MSRLNQTVSPQGRRNISEGRKKAYKTQNPATRAAQKAGQSHSYRRTRANDMWEKAIANKLKPSILGDIRRILRAWAAKEIKEVRLMALARGDVNYIDKVRQSKFT